MIEQDVIGHLIDMEHQASSLLLDAQVEADKRTAAARTQADAAFKTSYEDIIAGQEKYLNSEMKKIDEKRHSGFASFQKELEERLMDNSALSVLLDSLLFGK